MFSLSDMPSTKSVFSAYTSITASAMLIRTVVKEVRSLVKQFIPQQLQTKIHSKLEALFSSRQSAGQLTLIINEHDGFGINQLYAASEVYLRTKTTAASIKTLRVSKQPKEKSLTVKLDKDQDVLEVFEGVQLKWQFMSNSEDEKNSNRRETKFYMLTFDKQFRELVLDSYLPYVLMRSKEILQESSVLKLYALGFHGEGDKGGTWGSITLNHPSTFDTLALDINLKKEVLEDLDRFVRRREFYKRVGKPWKRGYLLYGPPGTGKSSLIAAMANYLNFNIYDLELGHISSNSALRRLLVATENRSILVIEDIDCSVDIQNRTAGDRPNGADKRKMLTLSGLLNFIDGLWSSCGDERIIIFTTNYKERLDPALLRPGRMDMHIHMSYCTPCGFKLLASNYLQIQSDPLFEEIESLIEKVNVTPAEIAEQLMKSDDAQASLKALIDFLQKKKAEYNASNAIVGQENKAECNTSNAIVRQENKVECNASNAIVPQENKVECNASIAIVGQGNKAECNASNAIVGQENKVECNASIAIVGQENKAECNASNAIVGQEKGGGQKITEQNGKKRQSNRIMNKQRKRLRSWLT